MKTKIFSEIILTSLHCGVCVCVCVFSGSHSNAPSQRECHSLTKVGSKLYLFGGNDQNKKFNELFVLDTGALVTYYLIFFI